MSTNKHQTLWNFYRKQGWFRDLDPTDQEQIIRNELEEDAWYADILATRDTLIEKVEDTDEVTS